MTEKWLSLTPNPPRIPIFYTLTKIHKPIPVGRPIISGCEGPTKRISSFVDNLLQPIAKAKKSYLKDTTHFISFIENTKVTENTVLVSMDVTSLYTNIPQEEGINTVCIAYEKFYGEKPPIPSQHLREMLRLILQENSFQFNGKNYLQTHGTAMGTKMAVAFANIFMSAVETRLISQSPTKPLVWKRYIDDIGVAFGLSLLLTITARALPRIDSFLIPPKNPYSNQATQKNTCQIFVPKKIPESKISTPKKSFDHPRHLKSGVPPLGRNHE